MKYILQILTINLLVCLILNSCLKSHETPENITAFVGRYETRGYLGHPELSYPIQIMEISKHGVLSIENEGTANDLKVRVENIQVDTIGTEHYKITFYHNRKSIYPIGLEIKNDTVFIGENHIYDLAPNNNTRLYSFKID